MRGLLYAGTASEQKAESAKKPHNCAVFYYSSSVSYLSDLIENIYVQKNRIFFLYYILHVPADFIDSLTGTVKCSSGFVIPKIKSDHLYNGP